MAESIFILILHTFLLLAGEGCRRALLKDFDVQLCMTKAKAFKHNTTHYIAYLLVLHRCYKNALVFHALLVCPNYNYSKKKKN